MRFNRLALQSSWLLVALLLLPGCNALNPLCGSARPSPSLSSVSPTTMVFSSLPLSFVLTATGGTGTTRSYKVVALTRDGHSAPSAAATMSGPASLNSTHYTEMVWLPCPGTGIFKVVVKTPSGNSGNLGCSSGGTSGAQTLTVN